MHSEKDVAADYQVSDYDRFYGKHIAGMAHSIPTVRGILESRGHDLKKIIAAGCGTGREIAYFHQGSLNAEVIGFDLLPEMAAQAKSNLEEVGIMAHLGTGDLLASGFNLDGVAEGADLIWFLGNSLAHIEPSQYATIFKNAAELLRPGGIFWIDFRDGYKYHAEKPKGELLAFNLNELTGEVYISGYYHHEAGDIREPYIVNFVENRSTFSQIALTEGHHQGSGHYVLPDELQTAWEAAGFTGEEITEHTGSTLLFQRHFLLHKGGDI